jgi:(1->4)-alpha-D-glucan 1-alpha-D-glucosylmutase
VSVDAGGAEVWGAREFYALAASVGCPPDPLGPNGQDWGLPPLVPHRLTEAAYEPFIHLLRDNMAQAGALRLDHVMGLRRLFWIPRGGKASDGAYLAYPFEDLLGILALESHRNRCLVIGEDLGTVPDEVRGAMYRERILSYKVLIFEREHGGEFKPPQHYIPQALVAATTHDLPTLAGFWTARDLTLRNELGLFANPGQLDAELGGRNEDRHRLLAALGREGLSPAGNGSPSASAMPAGLPLAVHAFLARTPCKVLVVQMEDVVGVHTPVNIPGTCDEYPNWRRRLPTDLEDLPGVALFESITTTLNQAFASGSRSSG